MSSVKRFLRRSGGVGWNPNSPNDLPSVDPSTITWEGLYDARAIVGFPDGTKLTTWADTSGNVGRNMTEGAATAPTYRATASPSGLPLVDFQVPVASARMASTYPVISNALGITVVSYVTIDTLPAPSIGQQGAVAIHSPGNQIILSAYFTPGAPTLPIPRPRLTVSTATSVMTAQPAITTTFVTTGPHVLIGVCRPPVGSGRIELWLDGRLIATADRAANGEGWAGTINVSPRLGGAGVTTSLPGKIGFYGVTSTALTIAQIVGLTKSLRGAFG